MRAGEGAGRAGDAAALAGDGGGRAGDARVRTVKARTARDDTTPMPGADGHQPDPTTASTTAGAAAGALLPEEPSADDLPGALHDLLAEVAGADTAPRDAGAVDRELRELPLPALRRRRELLLEEVRRAGQWTRLVRARRDLLVAATVGTDALEVPLEAGSHGGPLEAHLAAQAPAAGGPALGDPDQLLRGLVLPAGRAGSGGIAGGLRSLAAAARRLGAYEDALEAELELVTEALLRRYRELVAPVSRAAR